MLQYSLAAVIPILEEGFSTNVNATGIYMYDWK